MAAEATPPVPATLLLTADTVGGVWNYALELARGLVQRGVDVHLATFGGEARPSQRQQAAGIRGMTLHEGGHKLEWMQEPWDDVERAGQWLLELEAQLRPEVVHLNQFAFGALPFAAPKLVVAHSCVLSWWEAVRGVPAPRDWDDYHVRVSRGLAGADLVAAPTAAMLHGLQAHYGFKGPGRVLPNGRDPGEFRPLPKQPFILAAGRFWDDAKNLCALENVAPQLPWPVRVAGSCIAPHGGMLQPREVVPLGELAPHALADEMARAAIFAHPARYEPFGLSVLEAALSGCALVLGDIPSLRENWDGAALFVPPDDEQALREALQTLIAQPAKREQLVAASHARAMQLDHRRFIERYVEVYADLSAAGEGRGVPALAGTTQGAGS